MNVLLRVSRIYAGYKQINISSYLFAELVHTMDEKASAETLFLISFSSHEEVVAAIKKDPRTNNVGIR